MAIFRGTGTPTGGENVYSQAELDAAVAAALASETAAAASETAAEAAQTAAELAETNAETAETNAETAQTAAETAQTAAELAETNAETAETNAETAETGAEAAQTAAEAALDSFDDRYLGSKSSDPALDNDGNALLEGALYWKNTATKTMRVYDGAAWNDVSVSTLTHYNKTDSDARFAAITTPKPNLLLNGMLTVWQEGDTFTATTSGTAFAEMWKLHNTTTATFNTARRFAIADLEGNAADAVVQVADVTIASGVYVGLTHRSEGHDTKQLHLGTANAKTVTLSFWHYHTVPGTYCVALANDTHSAANRSYVAEYTQAVTNTWEQSVITIDLDTSGTWASTINTIGLEIRFTFAAGTTLHGTVDTWQAASNWATSSQVNGVATASDSNRIGNVKLEVGSTATDAQTPIFADELAKCQRYYEHSFDYGTLPVDSAGNGALPAGSAISTTLIYPGIVTYKVTKMFAAANITYYRGSNGATNGRWSYHSGGWQTPTANPTNNLRTMQGFSTVMGSVTVTQGYGYLLDGHWKAETRL